HNLENGEFGDRALELRENSPEDIRGAVMEMEGRLRGRGEMKEYQEGLQDQFWQNYPLVAGLHGTNKSRIGTLFLEKYKDLLQMTGEISNRL
ncbi:MAG: hypothetical protein KGJ11_01325, partial [Candidatus Omnitrophica bacterium]|nr:hypothetical protein [Candidatus Omnitrophota bacterium]